MKLSKLLPTLGALFALAAVWPAGYAQLLPILYNTSHWAITAIDLFQRANAPLTTPWTITAGGLNVVSDTVEVNAINTASHAMYAGTYNNNQFAQITVAAQNTGACGNSAIVRLSGSSPTENFYQISSNGTTSIVLSDTVNGTFNTLVSYTATVAVGDRIGIEVIGTTLNSYHNGALLGSFTDGSIASGNPGISVFSTVATTDCALSNFTAGNVTAVTASAPTADAFPRLGTYFIGGQPGSTYTAGWANYLAAHQVNVVSCFIGCGSTMAGGSRQSFVGIIHSASPSPVNARAFEYYITDACDPSPVNCNSAFTAPYTYINTNQPLWWAWSNAATQSGHIINTGSCSTCWSTNQTAAAPTFGGQTLEQYWAQLVYATYWCTGNADCANNLDGVYRDNVFTTPAFAIDYNASGSTTATSNTTYQQSLRTGIATGLSWWGSNTALPIIGNVAQWGTSAGVPITGYSGIMVGGLAEGALGESYSEITFGGYTNAQAQITTITNGMIGPKYTIIGHDNLAANGTDPYQATAYAALRFGLAFTLMQNGYYYANNNYTVGVTNWYDEWAVNPTTGVACQPTLSGGAWTSTTAASLAGCLGYLGQPTSTKGSVTGSGAAITLGNGMQSRLFYNAAAGTSWAVVVNPPSNGTQTATASAVGCANFKLETGTQAPTVNTGATVSSVTVVAYDGRVMQCL